MPWFKSKEKGAEICAALIDVLEKIDKDISTWDGKLCNKKFYLFLRERVKKYSKEHKKIIDYNFYANNFWLDGEGGAYFSFYITFNYDSDEGGINCYHVYISSLSSVQRAKTNQKERGKISYSKFHKLLNDHIQRIKEGGAMC